MTTERLGPKLTVHAYAYADRGHDQVVHGIAENSKYALTGWIIAADRVAVAQATANLRFTAGNFYVNDKPTERWWDSNRSAEAGLQGRTTRLARRRI